MLEPGAEAHVGGHPGSPHATGSPHAAWSPSFPALACSCCGGVVPALSGFVARLDGPSLSRPEAVALVELLTSLINTAEAARAIAGLRATEDGAHHEEAQASAAQWLAHSTYCSIGRARTALEAAAAAGSNEDLDRALRSGELTLEAAKLVSPILEVLPDAAEELIELAKYTTPGTLRRHVERVKALLRSEDDEVERAEDLWAKRSLRTWQRADGAFGGSFVLAPEAYAYLMAAIEQERTVVIEEARRHVTNDGATFEAYEAYEADALVALARGHRDELVFDEAPGEATPGEAPDTRTQPATGPAAGPRAHVLVRVDLAALRRGEVGPGETCEIQGVGAVPLALARELLGDAVVDLVVRDGVDVRTVCSLGRTIPRALRVALHERDRTCVVAGCTTSRRLEIDHWQVDFALGGRTELANLALLCQYHHRMKTYRGWRLVGGPGSWEFLPPVDAGRPGPFDTGPHESTGTGSGPPTGSGGAGPPAGAGPGAAGHDGALRDRPDPSRRTRGDPRAA